MTEYELVQSLFSGIEAYDSGFEFWLTGTFAVIVACHLGQDILDRWYMLFLAALYTMFSLNMLFRSMLASELILRYREQLPQFGVTSEAWLVSGNVVLASITFTVGFFGTLFFIIRTLRKKGM
jgi:hypothetical protein